MSSHSNSIQLVESLETTIRELIDPIEKIQAQIHNEESGYIPNGLELIAGELTMVVLVFSNVDLNITDEETSLLNNFRRAVCGDDAFGLTSDDYLDMCRRFLHAHPDRRLSIDQKPYTVQFLQSYDRQHKTEYAQEAIAIFLQLAQAVIAADGIERPQEMMTLLNFKEILDSQDSGRADLPTLQ